MADWTGVGRATAETYESMADVELRGVSPSYERLCRAVAADEGVCALIDALPAGKRQPNLLLASVRLLGGPVDDPVAFLDFVTSRWDVVERTVLSHRTQTNEPGRCAVLLPLLASFAQPLALLEVGASAGLCLYPDRYSYRYATSGGERSLGSGSVVLRCAVTGPAPLPDHLPEVVWRGGLDLNPLDTARAEDRRWLASLVWPEQVDRARRLSAAMDIVSASPPHLRAGDAVDDLPALVSEAPADVTLVVFHTAVLAYLSPDRRAAFARVMRQLQTSRPIHWVSNEAPGVVDGVDVEPRPSARFLLAHNQRAVGICGPHGHTLDWISRAARR